MRLSGRQMKYGVESAAPALLAGSWSCFFDGYPRGNRRRHRKTQTNREGHSSLRSCVVRQAYEASGLSDEELGDLLEAEKHAHRRGE